MQVTIAYGLSNSRWGTKLGDVLKDASVQSILGYGDEVDGQIMGIPRDSAFLLADGTVVRVCDSSCSKEWVSKFKEFKDFIKSLGFSYSGPGKGDHENWRDASGRK